MVRQMTTIGVAEVLVQRHHAASDLQDVCECDSQRYLFLFIEDPSVLQIGGTFRDIRRRGCSQIPVVLRAVLWRDSGGKRSDRLLVGC